MQLTWTVLSSKDILERTGISRATLNNYIAAGLVARPEVLPPGPNDGGAPRLGYFADDTVEKIETIQRLKREGWSLGRILEHLAPGVAPGGLATAGAIDIPAAAAAPRAPQERSSPQMQVVAVLGVTLHDAQALWVTVSVQDYFALVSEVESELRSATLSHQGMAARLAPYRFLCHFLPQGGDQLARALRAATLIGDAIAEVSARWKALRGWDIDIVANIGLAVGEAWVNPTPAGDVQFVGEVMGDALQLAAAGRMGALLITRDFIGRLPAGVRTSVVHGVPGRHMGFAPLKTLAAKSPGLPRRLADMPVTEFIEFSTPPAPGEQEES